MQECYQDMGNNGARAPPSYIGREDVGSGCGQIDPAVGRRSADKHRHFLVVMVAGKKSST